MGYEFAGAEKSILLGGVNVTNNPPWEEGLRLGGDSMTLDYNAIAGSYARNRRASQQVIAELCAFRALARASRVLEVGCGPANHICGLVDATGCGGWGIEPSDAMRERARARGQVGVSKGTAE